MNTPPLEQGIALILFGSQGCGKSALARSIAVQYGPVQDCEVTQLNSARDLNSLLLGRPAVLIVEGLPTRPDQWPAIRTLMTTRKSAITSCGRVQVVTNPHLIFCTNEPVPQALRESRRFQVIDIEARAAA
ncbi:MAG: hypothetical protein ACT6UH_00535 [Hydrogenophaga sp.]|uniref:hypothetical protein n=1 Tax=Hydrogenophaga sp. TaxID=1904254 RepID=UPI00403587B0